MTPEQIAYADGVKGLVVAGALLFLWVLGRILVPKRFPAFAASRHAQTLSWGWLLLTTAWFFNAASLWSVGTGRMALSWACLALSATFRIALIVVVVWRLLTKPQPTPEGTSGPGK
jgi:hypothetical protein